MATQYPQDVEGFHRDPVRYPTDGEVLWIPRDSFRMERDPRSDEDFEIIQFHSISEQEDNK